MGEPLMKAIYELSEEQISFIVSETGVSSSYLFAASEGELDVIYDQMCDIEISEIDDNGYCSTRGNTAADIVTILGNAIAKDEGYWDECDNDCSD